MYCTASTASCKHSVFHLTAPVNVFLSSHMLIDTNTGLPGARHCSCQAVKQNATKKSHRLRKGSKRNEKVIVLHLNLNLNWI